MTDTLERVCEYFKVKRGTSPVEITDRSRSHLPRLFRYLGFTTGAEIGVASGNYSKLICELMPGVKLYCVDPYQAYPGYKDYDQERLDRMGLDSKRRLEKYGVNFVRQPSAEAHWAFADCSLDFVYIDANHDGPWVAQDIYYWTKKIRGGGIISGHDYFGMFPGVVEAVNNYTTAFEIEPWFLIGSKVPVNGDERARSWFWVVR